MHGDQGGVTAIATELSSFWAYSNLTSRVGECIVCFAVLLTRTNSNRL